MITALIRKELRHLLPVILALAGLMLWHLVANLILQPPDSRSFAGESWLFQTAAAGSWTAIAELLLGVLIAYSLLPGEHAQRTIEFLYTLPVRRRTLFLVKYLVGAGIHATASVLGTLELLLRHTLNPNSFERRLLEPRFVWWHLAADLFLPLVAVAYGMLLSYFRRLGWILFALIWMALELIELTWPTGGLFSVKALSRVEHAGLQPLINWRAWAVHAVMAALALLLAGRLWLGRQEGWAAFHEKLRTSVVLRRLGGGLAVLALALTIGSAIATSINQPATGGDDSDGAAGAGGTTASALRTFDTRHFRFTYLAAQAPRAMRVIHDADQAHTRVQRWLSAPDVDRISADLTDSSAEHLGMAGWTKMRLNLARPIDDALLRHVLYHETTHVMAAALTPGISNQRALELRFFAEGLAEYVAFELLDPASETRAKGRQVAALAHLQFHLRFEDLLAPVEFMRRHDEYLLYPLGEIWTAALVATCGPASPAQVLRTFASAETPRTLEGFDLWRHALQGQRCDLDRVIGAFEQTLRRLEPRAAEVPLASAALVGSEGSDLVFEVSVRARAPGPWDVDVRARAGPDAAPGTMVIRSAPVSVGQTVQIRVPVPAGAGQRLEFQVGAHHGGRVALFSRWQSTARP